MRTWRLHCSSYMNKWAYRQDVAALAGGGVSVVLLSVLTRKSGWQDMEERWQSFTMPVIRNLLALHLDVSPKAGNIQLEEEHWRRAPPVLVDRLHA